MQTSGAIRAARTRTHILRYCEEQSDEAIHSFFVRQWIASLALAMTVNVELLQSFRNTIEAIQPVISAMQAVTRP